MKIQQFKPDHSEFASLSFRVFVNRDNKHFWDYREGRSVESGWSGNSNMRWILFHWEG